MNELIEGKSVEVYSRKMKSKDAYKLNSMYWDAVEANPIRNIIRAYPNPRSSFMSDKGDIKLWMGRGHGEVLVRKIVNKSKHGKNEIITAKVTALILISHEFGIDEELAMKYLLLNEEQFFEEEKNETIAEYWLRRVNIDLKNYKELLEEIKPEPEKEEVL